MKSIVTPEWLFEQLNNPKLIVLHAGLEKPKPGTIAIKKAQYFDVKNVFSNTDSKFPNTFPSDKKFEENCQELGINNNSTIVVYDDKGIYSSPRVWWMLKTMGHKNVAVLNGGLPNWISKKYPTTTSFNTKQKIGNFKVEKKPGSVKDFEFLKNNIITSSHQVIDARSSDRFNGLTKESRKGLRSGHIPNSINIPFLGVLENGEMKSKTELKTILNDIPSDGKLIFSCGSGITACILLLAAQQINNNEMTIYDGSWTEWATLSDQ